MTATSSVVQEPSGGDAGFRSELFRARLKEAQAEFDAEFAAARAELDAHLDASDREAADLTYRRIQGLLRLGRHFRDLNAPSDGTAVVPVYLVSTLFLRTSYEYCIRDPAEQMHFVTGSELGPCRVLERLVEFEKSSRSAVAVSGELRATHRALIELSNDGHRLTAWCHSHPGVGPAATLPSGIDRGHQERLERGGYPAIGLIFSRDGHVRFFSHAAPFKVEIFGKGVRRVDERIYQLSVDPAADDTGAVSGS